MNALIIPPGYPADMPEFTHGLGERGARVIGLGDRDASALPELARRCLDDYIRVPSLWRSRDVIEAMRHRLRGQALDRIECLWEPGIMLAAELRGPRERIRWPR